MKTMAKVLLAYMLVMSVAHARCPPDKPYGCTQQSNGKQLCGCGMGY